jgi:hypothetical protein
LKPINSQLFYYVLLVYAIGMVAYVVLPMKSTLVIADSAARARPDIVLSAPSATGSVEVVSHSVSTGGTAQPVPLISTPIDNSVQTPEAVKDAPKSL